MAWCGIILLIGVFLGWQAYALSPAGPGYGGGSIGATSPVGSGGGPGPGGGPTAAAEPFAADSPYFPFSTGAGRGTVTVAHRPLPNINKPSQSRGGPLQGQTATAAALPPPASALSLRLNSAAPNAKDAPDASIVDGQHWVVSTFSYLLSTVFILTEKRNNQKINFPFILLIHIEFARCLFVCY